MIRHIVVAAVIFSGFGCRQQSPETSPAGASQESGVSSNPSDVPQDSFRLRVDDVPPDANVGKRIFTISVPSSATRILVSMGPTDQPASWSLNLEPSSEPERICTFEVLQPVVEKDESGKSVTVTCRLTTPTSTSESPLGFTGDETTKLDEVVSFADSASEGLHKMNKGVVLGNVKLGTRESTPLTLFVMDEQGQSTEQ